MPSAELRRVFLHCLPRRSPRRTNGDPDMPTPARLDLTRRLIPLIYCRRLPNTQVPQVLFEGSSPTPASLLILDVDGLPHVTFEATPSQTSSSPLVPPWHSLPCQPQSKDKLCKDLASPEDEFFTNLHNTSLKTSADVGPVVTKRPAKYGEVRYDTHKE